MNGKPPTKAERAWMDAITELGCIVCKNDLKRWSPASPHHILRGGKRIDHFHTIPLCFHHHQSGFRNDIFVSRHPYKAEFERRYGTERELLEQVRELVGEMA